MNDHEAFLRSVIAEPDDGPRLVFADWLDEQGDPHGEFIRAQCELARWSHIAACDLPAAIQRLRRRALELFQTHGRRWFADIPGTLKYGVEGETEFDTFEGYRYAVRRGFVEEIICTLTQFFGGPCGRCNGGLWLGVFDTPDGRCPNRCDAGRLPGVAAALARATPLTKVWLSDRGPDLEIAHVTGFTWLPEPFDDPFEVGPHPRPRYWSPSDPPHVLPHRLYDMVMGHRTKNVAESPDDCRAWLSRGCVLLARELARPKSVRT